MEKPTKRDVPPKTDSTAGLPKPSLLTLAEEILGWGIGNMALLKLATPCLASTLCQN